MLGIPDKLVVAGAAMGDGETMSSNEITKIFRVRAP
jgi:hypothetical protein